MYGIKVYEIFLDRIIINQPGDYLLCSRPVLFIPAELLLLGGECFKRQIAQLFLDSEVVDVYVATGVEGGIVEEGKTIAYELGNGVGHF